MSKELIIRALKDRSLREKMETEFFHPSGSSIEELSIEEMENIQGAYDVQPDTTPLCFVASATVGGATGLGFSIMFCNKDK
ncbi:mersacidin family lantibiotic [Priestia megaterium]|uniref:mersacidin family lantibiotic n=1 Tax=Priestia megaterium TaxID=1404 RepID=UPI0036D8CBFE